MTDFEGRVAIVTGSTKGIGRAIAADLLAEGFNVVVTARTAEDVERAAMEMGAEGSGAVLGVACDVRDSEACKALVAQTLDRFGRLDLLVNNAGIGKFAPIQDMPPEDWSLQIDTNLTGVFYLSQAAIPALKESPDAWIINIGSLAGRNTFAGGAAYNASKFGLLGMSEAMMLDLRYEGIRVSLVMPGSVDTSFGDRPAGSKSGWALTSEDVSRAVLDLLRYPGNALASRVELRPTKPPKKG
jgi:NAD(P)-dependent dehydrogenase (short-subunit alcohol dehydrogenase family)